MTSMITIQPDLQKSLLHHYIKINLPGAGVFTLIYLLNKISDGTPIMTMGASEASKWWIISILMLQGIFAVVLPLWYRILFINRMKTKKNTSLQVLLRFEKNFLSLACPSLYLLIPGYLLSPAKASFTAMILFALYALYFYFPSHKRVIAEKKWFNVQEKEATHDAL